VANIVDYVTNPIQSGLKDVSPYVRKTAVLGCVKLFYMSPHAVRNSGIVDKLLDMVRDKDPQVVTNVLCALKEILDEEGGIPVDKAMVHHLLNRIKEFSEWSQCIVLDLVSKYNPGSDEDEIFDIMNLLEERLKHSNSAVILATTKIFLHLTQSMPDVHVQVYERIRTPMLTMMAGSAGHELGFAILHHINLLVQRAPEVFEHEFKQFFCKHNDPGYVKVLKLDIITAIASESNALAIVEELVQYVNDSVEVARRSIRACATVAVQVSSAAESILSALLGLLDLKVDYVSAEVMTSTADILRKYPEMHAEVTPVVSANLRSIEDPDARVAMIWVLGEFGEHVDEAPYLLEPLAASLKDEIPRVRMQLLSTVMRLFFKRPPECQALLGKVLQQATLDSSHQDVHDRAMLYYRLLAYDVDEAAAVVNCQKDPIYKFTEATDSDVKDRLFDEFNSLSVIYGQPAEAFIVKVSLEEEIQRRKALMAPEPGKQGGSAGQAAQQAGDDEEADPTQAGLLGGDDEEEVDGGGDGGLALSPQGVVAPADFQQKWTSLPGETARFNLAVPPAQIEPRLAGLMVRCIASGTAGGSFKGYFYGIVAGSGSVVLTEIIVAANGQGPAAVTVRADNPQTARPFVALLQKAIGGN
jgi:AP-4 complex subunit beta-1